MLGRKKDAAESPNAAMEVLHATVEKAVGLLPAKKDGTCDAFVTLRAIPKESRHTRRTDVKSATRDPVRVC